MTSQVWVPDRHHRHHRHQPLNFNGLGVTRAPSSLSPCSSPLPWPDIGDEDGDASVTQSQVCSSPHNQQKDKAFCSTRVPGDDGDTKIPTPSRQKARAI